MKIQTKKNSEITKAESKLMYESKLNEYGSQNIRDFKKDYPNSIFFFVKEDNKIVAFGTFRNLTVELSKKKYKILGLCNIFTIKRKKGYGKILIKAMIDYAKKTRKTALGFCVPKNTPFYTKSGLKASKNLITKMVYKNPQGKLEPEDDADGVYYEGKDKFVTKLIKSKSVAYTDLKDW